MGKSLKHIFVFAATILAMLLLSCSQKKDVSSNLPPSSDIAYNASSDSKANTNASKTNEDSGAYYDDFDYESTDLDEAEGRAFMIRGHENLDSLSN